MLRTSKTNSGKHNLEFILLKRFCLPEPHPQALVKPRGLPRQRMMTSSMFSRNRYAHIGKGLNVFPNPYKRSPTLLWHWHRLKVGQAHLQRGGALASGHVPHAHSLVPTAAEQLAAVRAVRHTVNISPECPCGPEATTHTPPLSLSLTSLTQT